jgi:hypothetical protein
MSPGQSTNIMCFWAQVRQVERRIRENGHRPRPVDVEGIWNCEFEDAYEAIHPILACISKPRLFNGVSSLPRLRGPFDADNAHQALMFQLNPEEAMDGDPSLLESAEYRDLRKQAELEVEMLARMDRIPIAIPILPLCGASVWQPDYETRWAVPDRSGVSTDRNHQNRSEVPAPATITAVQQKMLNAIRAAGEPVRGEKISELIDCSFDTVRRYVGVLMRQNLIHRVSQGYVYGANPQG